MQKALSDYLDEVCGGLRDEVLAEALRAELTAHLQEYMADCMKEGETPERAAREAVRRMGSPERLRKYIVRAHRPRGSIAFALGGALLFLFALLAAILTAGMVLTNFLDAASLLFVLLSGAGLALLASAKNLSWRQFFSNMRVTSLIGGGLCTLIGIINFSFNAHSLPADAFAPSIAVALLGLFYGVILCGLSIALTKWNTPLDVSHSLGKFLGAA